MDSNPLSAGRRARRASAGFTLIELIVTIALISIMLSLAVPSFVRFQRSAQLTASANNFVAAVAAARAEAMKRNHDAYIRPDIANDWSRGWKVFVDMDSGKNGAYTEADGDILISQEVALPTGVTVPDLAQVNRFGAATDGYVLFNGSGFPRRRGGVLQPSSSIEFASSFDSTLRRRVLLAPAGRMRVCTPPADAGCAESDI